MMLFLADILLKERGRISYFIKGLHVDYKVNVNKVDNLDDAIVVAQNVEDMIIRKTRAKHRVGEKIVQEELGGFKKKRWG